MTRRELFFLVFILATSCWDRGSKYDIDRTLTVMEHRTGATSANLAISDFSVVQGFQYHIDTVPLTMCRCLFRNDTLSIFIGYPSERVISAVYQVVGEDYSSGTVFESDVPEYNGEYSFRVESLTDRLVLNKSNFVVSDTLLGRFQLKSDTVRLSIFDSLNNAVTFDGRFQCIISEQ